MFRLQTPLPQRYTDATDDELAEMIGAARTELGQRVVILGHHYRARRGDALGGRKG